LKAKAVQNLRSFQSNDILAIAVPEDSFSNPFFILDHGETPTYIVIALALGQQSIFPRSESTSLIVARPLFERIIDGQGEAPISDDQYL
jgi:hypothetical protein